MIDRYDRLPEWVRWILLVPLSAAYTFIVAMLLSLVSLVLHDASLMRSAVAIVTFAYALHEFAPRWKNRLVVVSLILHMVFSIAPISFLLIVGATPSRATWSEMGSGLVGSAAGWLLYFSVFQERRE
jgi:predicted outer membrane lipoprotein